jgi:glyoxylase-like metal-dependent hydrolase (beta-lactamase superfamily II)
VIRPGVPFQLIEDRLVRITANNGSMMTGPGTNTYLLCSAVDEWVVIDPGPNDDAHVEATLLALQTLGGRLTKILVTHTHIDHSPAARALKEATGALCLGRLADHPALQDAGFVPDKHLRGGERLAFGSDCVVRVIHTPGHASNHLCYLLEGERILFTGDHVMQGSTVIVNPPDGDMDAYLTSLEDLIKVAGQDFDAFAPGHGFLMEDTSRVLAGLIAHRLRREEKVRLALAEMRSASLDELVVHVYDDVDVARHRVAKRSLAAHLLRLERLGQAKQHEGRWLSSLGRVTVSESGRSKDGNL